MWYASLDTKIKLPPPAFWIRLSPSLPPSALFSQTVLHSLSCGRSDSLLTCTRGSQWAAVACFGLLALFALPVVNPMTSVRTWNPPGQNTEKPGSAGGSALVGNKKVERVVFSYLVLFIFLCVFSKSHYVTVAQKQLYFCAVQDLQFQVRLIKFAPWYKRKRHKVL